MIDFLNDLRVFDRLMFITKTHKYMCDNKPSARLSVTSFVNSFKEQFNKDKWSKIEASKYGLSQEDILSSWNEKNTFSTVLGTVFHGYADNYYHNKVVPYDKDWVSSQLSPEKHLELRETISVINTYFCNFYNDTRKYLLPIKNEFVVGDLKDTKICGMLDMLAYNLETDEFEIYDFKTNKEIKKSCKFNKKLLPPVDNLDDCEFCSYGLQLGLYKKFIEDNTRIKIGKLYVVWLNKNNENYKLIQLDNYEKEIDLMLKSYNN